MEAPPAVIANSDQGSIFSLSDSNEKVDEDTSTTRKREEASTKDAGAIEVESADEYVLPSIPKRALRCNVRGSKKTRRKREE